MLFVLLFCHVVGRVSEAWTAWCGGDPVFSPRFWMGGISWRHRQPSKARSPRPGREGTDYTAWRMGNQVFLLVRLWFDIWMTQSAMIGWRHSTAKSSLVLARPQGGRCRELSYWALGSKCDDFSTHRGTKSVEKRLVGSSLLYIHIRLVSFPFFRGRYSPVPRASASRHETCLHTIHPLLSSP